MNKLSAMNFFRLNSKPISTFWIVFLFLSILNAQHLQFHVHSLDHGSITQAGPEHRMVEPAHRDITQKHLSIDASHANHHDEILYEMDASPSSIVQKSVSTFHLMDLFALFFVVFIVTTATLPVRQARYRYIFCPPPRFHLIPLLRAPPC